MRSFSSVAVAAVATCLLFAAAAEAQASACQTKAVTLQSSCSAFQNAVKQNAALIGASDADLQKAIDSSKQKPSTACCNGIKDFAGSAPYTTCACDPTVDSLAQSQGVTPDGLITLLRVGAIACKPLGVTFSAPTQTTKCPAKSG